MIIKNSVKFNIEAKIDKGADIMKVIICIVGMMAGAVLLEQMVDATKIMRIGNKSSEFNR